MRSWSVAFVALLGALLLPVAAAAHAVLLESSPVDGAVLDRAPAEVFFRFNEPVSPVFVRLIDSAGQVRELGGTRLATELRLSLPALPAGTVAVSYRMISADSHPVGGSLVFSIGAPGGGAEAAAVWDWSMAVAIHRLAFYLGALGAAGAAFFLFLVGAPPEADAALRRLINGTALLGAALALLGIGIKGGQLLSASPGQLAELATWQLGLGTSAGSAFIVALLGCAVVRLATLLPHRVVGAVGGAVIVASFPISGHSALMPPLDAVRIVTFAHVAAAAFWIGALAPLWLVLRLTPHSALDIVRRFSRWAVAVVALLLALGAALALGRIGTLPALRSSEYGLLLILKLAGVAVLLGVAAVNKFRLTRILAANGNPAPLCRAIVIEMLVALAVLAATANLSQTPPPALENPVSFSSSGKAVVVAGQQVHAMIELVPAQRGRNTLRANLTTPDSAAIQSREVIVELSMPERGIEPIRRVLAARQGSYETDIDIPASGRWRFELKVLVDDFTRATLTSEIRVE